MRTTMLLATAFLVLAPAVQAADTDSCSQATPCHWIVDYVDETGLHSQGGLQWNGTQGDWFVLNATNLDVVAHTLRLDGYGWTLQLAPGAASETAPFQLTQAGTFLLRDDASHTGKVLVTKGDVNDYNAGVVDANGSATSTASSKGAPASGAFTLAAVAAVALLMARRSPPA